MVRGGNLWPVKRRVPEQRADSRQQAAQRESVIRDVNTVYDHYPNIAFEADGRAWPANLRQDMPRGRGELTAVEAVAEHSIFGAGDRRRRGETSSSDWLAGVKEAAAHFVNMAAQAKVLDPPKAKRLGRQNSVEVCSLCREPIGGPVRRVDGLPYHSGPAGSPWCYYKVWRSR